MSALSLPYTSCHDNLVKLEKRKKNSGPSPYRFRRLPIQILAWRQSFLILTIAGLPKHSPKKVEQKRIGESSSIYTRPFSALSFLTTPVCPSPRCLDARKEPRLGRHPHSHYLSLPTVSYRIIPPSPAYSSSFVFFFNPRPRHTTLTGQMSTSPCPEVQSR